MIEKVINILSKKHLLILGKSEMDRSKFISKLIEKANYETFRFPKGMKSINEYIDFVRINKLYEPWYTKKGNFGSDQILDFHRDWITDNHSLIILEEFQNMEERWKLDVLRSYIEEVAFRKKDQKSIHLIISQENEKKLLEKLSNENWFSGNDNRTERQIIDGSFEIIEIQ